MVIGCKWWFIYGGVGKGRVKVIIGKLEVDAWNEWIHGTQPIKFRNHIISFQSCYKTPYTVLAGSGFFYTAGHTVSVTTPKGRLYIKIRF